MAGFVTIAWACIRRDTVFGWKDFSVHSLADSFFVLVFGGISYAFAATWQASFPPPEESDAARTLHRSATSSTGELEPKKGFWLWRDCELPSFSTLAQLYLIAGQVLALGLG